MTMIALYPWENVDMAVREQAEQEIWSDEEYQQWLDELLADSGWLEADGQQPAANSQQPADMDELEFMAYMADQLEAQPAAEILSFADVMLRAPRSGGWSQALLDGEVDVLPDWQRDDYVGS